MPDYNHIENQILELAKYIDGRIEIVTGATQKAQEEVYKILQESIFKFEIKEGHYVSSQDLSKQLVNIRNNVEKVLYGKQYALPINEFLTDLGNIQTRTIDLHKSINKLEAEIDSLPAARKIIYEQAKTTLLDSGAIAQNYLDPMNRVIANNVLQGNSISKTVKALEKWNKGELSSGRLNNGMPAPNLQRYATQMARDAAYSMNRTTNDIFKEHYGLNKFIYVGNLVEDSRQLCVHLVGLNRTIDLDEMPALIAKYPNGLYPSTTKENFITNCGGYGCMHLCHSVA